MIPNNANPFGRLRPDLDPTEEQRARVLKRVKREMTTPVKVQSIRDLLEPDASTRIRIWNRIREQIAPTRARGFLEHVRVFLTPEESVLQIGRAFRPHLEPVLVPVRPLKWVAAFVVVLVMLRVSPLLFLAPETIAQSNVLLRPTRGEVSISLDGLSQPVEAETELLQPASIHTDDGEATIILHDDGTIRLAPHTSVTLQDLSDRPQLGSGLATLILTSGTVWVQGLVPDHLRGLSVVTPQGMVTVNGGSMSVTVQESDVVVEAWDRHATLEREEQADVVVIAGERLTAHGTTTLAVEQMPDSAFDKPWVSQNLQRDAVHQRVIAQEQRERSAARAGILPTSRLYPVKRIAEEVDVLFTFNHEDAVKKRIAQATTRLNEATTLIAEGQSGATVQLDEYRVAMLDLANGSGDTLTQQLVEQGAAENVAQLSAQLPDDDVYVVKKAVLDTTSDLPSKPINQSDVEASVIADTVDALQIATVEGDQDAVQARLETLAPYIADLPQDTDLDPTTKKEVLSQLTHVADALQDDAKDAAGSGAVALRAVSRVIRTHIPTPSQEVVHLTGDEITAMVASILDRVFTYSQYTGQTNQLHLDIKRLADHPDAGTILRRLYEELQKYEELNSVGVSTPDFRLSLIVRAAIRDLREEQSGDID